MKKQNKNKTRGYIMAGTGFFLIVMNALSYLLHGERNFVAIGIIGLVFVVVGMNMSRRK